MQPPARGRRGRPEDGRDLRRRKAFPLREQEDLAITRPESPQRLVHERLLAPGRRLLRSRGRLECEPLLECAAPATRPPLVRDHPPGGRVQPHARRIAVWQVVQATPGGEEDLGDGILGVTRGPGSPAAVGDDVAAVRREQRRRTACLRSLSGSPMHCTSYQTT